MPQSGLAIEASLVAAERSLWISVEPRSIELKAEALVNATANPTAALNITKIANGILCANGTAVNTDALLGVRRCIAYWLIRFSIMILIWPQLNFERLTLKLCRLKQIMSL
jgi:hypothetical protein